jgi:phage FluMu protein Com
MFKTSHLQELKRRYKEMYASPEEGTNELVDQYKKETPGQSEEIEEDTDKDKPGTQGDQAEYQRKRKEIAKKFGVESCSALKDEKERKACYAALDAAHVSDDEESEDDDPVGKNEEVKVDEAKKPTRTTGMECMECGKKFRAKLSTLQYGRTKCPKCKSTDLDFAYGESVEEDVEVDEAWGGVRIDDLGMEHDDKLDIQHWNNKQLQLYVDKKLKAKPGTPKRKEIIKAINKIRNGAGMPLFKEEVELAEKGTAYPATIDTLRMIVKDKQHQTVMFKSGKAIVDLFTASAMVQVYDALKKPDMKKTFEKMIADKAGFMKTQAFAMKMIG